MTNLETFAQGLAAICERCPLPLARARPLRWTVIANPVAGGFTIRSRWQRHLDDLTAGIALAAANPPHPDASPSLTGRRRGGILGSSGLVPTETPGHAAQIAASLLEEAAADPGPFHLVIAAGGDGTSLEVQEALFHAPVGVRERMALLRLPMGTGNDGSDGWELAASLGRIIRAAGVDYRPGVRLTTATPGKGPYLAFNILSVGIDAFVTHMTNKMKGRLPGNSYKLMVDVASLFYDRLYRSGPMDVEVFDREGAVTDRFREAILLMALGASGNRTYGAHQHILPDSRNLCVVGKMSVLRKIAIKGRFRSGTHGVAPEVRLLEAHGVRFSGAHPILAQMDGEAVLLTPPDFPATMELTEARIPVLVANEQLAVSNEQ
jgi:diacylglycerol kinase family enzyme